MTNFEEDYQKVPFGSILVCLRTDKEYVKLVTGQIACLETGLVYNLTELVDFSLDKFSDCFFVRKYGYKPHCIENLWSSEIEMT